MSGKNDELNGFDEGNVKSNDELRRLEKKNNEVSAAAAKADELAGFEEAAVKKTDEPKATVKESDVYTEVEEVQKSETQQPGFGTQLKSSIQGVFIGLILFLASFFILYKGETRVDRSGIVKRAKAVQPVDGARSADSQTVKFTGKATTSAPVTDDQYLPHGKFLALSRHAEMYAWVEESETRAEPGSTSNTEKKITTYRYRKEWTSQPPDSSRFKKPEGHENPSMAVESKKWTAQSVTVGSLAVDLSAARIMGAESVAAPSRPTPPKAFDPNAPEGQNPVVFSEVPTVATPVETKAAPGKRLLLYTITKDTYDASGRWIPGKTSLTLAEGITIGRVKIDTTDLKVGDLSRPGKILYKPASAADAPVAGNERATVLWIEIGAPATFSGTLDGDMLRQVTVSDQAGGAAPLRTPWYVGQGSPDAPQVGDIRLSFTGIPLDATLFVCGKLQGGIVGPADYKGVSFLVATPMNEKQVLAELQSEHTLWTWVARVGGFLCMWIGMSMMAGPLTFLLSYIPVLGDLAGAVLRIIFGLIALVLSVLTIFFVRFFWLLLIIAVAVALLAIVKHRQARPAAK